MTTRAEQLKPGDTIVYGYGPQPVHLVIIEPAVTEPDRFGRPLMRFWCRRADTGEEGYMSYGAGGIADTL